MKILVTGGTVFVSKFTAAYFAEKGCEVFVLNRGTRPQVPGVTLIRADRSALRGALKGRRFDAVIDVCAYTQADIENLLSEDFTFTDYIFISSSAVYPETLPQPFTEDQPVGRNSVWGDYGVNKILAERCLQKRVPGAYILRPPYLYGPMQNLYREPFVFDCARQGRKFYLPGEGKMKLQFFAVEDMCRVIEKILETHPAYHVLNVGNEQPVDVRTFAQMCYQAAGADFESVCVRGCPNQRDYFSFYDYEYVLDITRMKELLPVQKDLLTGLRESYDWYCAHTEDVIRKPYLEFIDSHF